MTPIHVFFFCLAVVIITSFILGFPRIWKQSWEDRIKDLTIFAIAIIIILVTLGVV